MRNYELIEELGKGTYSEVYRARRLDDNQIVAVRQVGEVVVGVVKQVVHVVSTNV